MCDKIVSKESFTGKYCPDKYKTQEICFMIKDVDFHWITLRFIFD